MREWLSIDDVARLEGAPYMTIQKRLRRRRIALMNDPDDSRRKLAPVTGLSPEARAKWLREQINQESGVRSQESEVGNGKQEQDPAAGAHGEILSCPDELPEPRSSAIILAKAGTARASLPQEFKNRSQEPGVSSQEKALARLQPSLAFAPASPSQAARDAVVAAIPKGKKEYVERWMDTIADNVNGTWKLYRGKEYAGYMIANGHDFIRAQAHLRDISVSSIYSKLKLARSILKDPDIPEKRKWTAVAESLVPKPRPGRSGHSYFADAREEVAWQFPTLRSFYLNQAQFSIEAAHKMLLDLIEMKQRAWEMGHYYPRPTIYQTRTALEKISKPERVLARQGEKAFNDKCAPYLSRDYSTLHSNDLWVTDQRLVNVRLRGAGEQLGRIWLVNFIDVASFKWVGFWAAPILSSEAVMLAAAMALARHGVPGAIHMDLGKEFTCQAFNGSVRKFSGEVLYREASGLWDRLKVRVVKAIGRNPQTKTIERWHHVVDDFDKRFPGWCGSNTDERPEKLLAEEKQHAAWLTGEAERSPLVRVEQYILAFADWVENEWNARHRGRGKILEGATPNEAYYAKRSAEGFRTLTLDQIDHETAERRSQKVKRGGQVNLSFYKQEIEYTAPELFPLIGEQVEVIRSRRSLRQVTVIYPIAGGTASCVALAKPQFHWLSDDPDERDLMKQAIRCKTGLKRLAARGFEARSALSDAENPLELLAAQRELRASKLQSKDAMALPEISSTEYMGEKLGLRRRPKAERVTQWNDDSAERILKIMESENGTR